MIEYFLKHFNPEMFLLDRRKIKTKLELGKASEMIKLNEDIGPSNFFNQLKK